MLDIRESCPRANLGGVSRRAFLYGAGTCLALPAMESLLPTCAAQSAPASSPKRLVVSAVNYGMNPAAFHPTHTGSDYEMPEVLGVLEKHRKDFTVFSNLDHGLKGGHAAEHAFLSGVLAKDGPSQPDGNIALDQFIADRLAGQTRFSSLTLGLSGRLGVGWTRNGIAVPGISTPHKAFQQLFHSDDPKTMRQQQALRDNGASILDTVRESAAQLNKRLIATDRERLDQYLTAVRETELVLHQQTVWSRRPKPKAPFEIDKDVEESHEVVKQWYDVAYLALATDSSRVITVGPKFEPSDIEGISRTHHSLTHHGKNESILKELLILERFVLREYGAFLDRLKAHREADGSTLLDDTMVLFGSGMGDGNRHHNANLPLLLAGGGFKHGNHIDVQNKQPLNSLYLSMIQQFGIEVDAFHGSTGTFNGLERA